MSEKKGLHLLLLDALGGLVEECRIRPSESRERATALSGCMLALVDVLGYFQSNSSRNEILEQVSKLYEIVLTNHEFDSAVSDALLKLSEGPTSDPSENVKRTISTIPPPRKSSDPPEEDL